MQQQIILKQQLNVADPTADRTITFADETGTVITTGSTDAVTEDMMLQSKRIKISCNFTNIKFIRNTTKNIIWLPVHKMELDYGSKTTSL